MVKCELSKVVKDRAAKLGRRIIHEGAVVDGKAAGLVIDAAALTEETITRIVSTEGAVGNRCRSAKVINRATATRRIRFERAAADSQSGRVGRRDGAAVKWGSSVGIEGAIGNGSASGKRDEN